MFDYYALASVTRAEAKILQDLKLQPSSNPSNPNNTSMVPIPVPFLVHKKMAERVRKMTSNFGKFDKFSKLPSKSPPDETNDDKNKSFRYDRKYGILGSIARDSIGFSITPQNEDKSRKESTHTDDNGDNGKNNHGIFRLHTLMGWMRSIGECVSWKIAVFRHRTDLYPHLL